MLKQFALAGNKPSMVYTPDVVTGRLPCVIHANGIGENDNDGEIDLVFRHGWMNHLRSQTFKPEGIVVVNIFPPVDFPDPIYLTQVIDSVLERLPVDPRRVFASGLSAGAESWAIYAERAQSFVRRLAGMILMSVTHKPCEMAQGSPYLLSHLKNVPIWWLHGDKDGWPHSWAKAQEFHNLVKGTGNAHTRFTTLKGVGHGGWNTMTSPNFGTHANNTYNQSLWDFVRNYSTATAMEPLEYRPSAVFMQQSKAIAGERFKQGVDQNESEVTSQSNMPDVNVEMQEDGVQVLRSPEQHDTEQELNRKAPTLDELVDNSVRNLVTTIHNHYQSQNQAQEQAAKRYEPKTEEQTMRELIGGGSQEPKTLYQQRTDTDY